MSKPIPSIAEMLDVAEGCGLKWLDEAYSNYVNHYTLFFYIPEYQQQMLMFTAELKFKNLTETEDGKLKLKDLTIEEARTLL